MSTTTQNEIVANLIKGLNVSDIDGDDLKLWALICTVAQLSESANSIFLHRNCDPRYAAVVMMLRRAGKLAHKLRESPPSRGSVDYTDKYLDDELGEALAYLYLACTGDRPSLQARALRFSRETAKLADALDTSDLTGDPEDEELRQEMKDWEVLSDEALTLFENDLRAERLDAGRDDVDLDPRVLPASDSRRGLGNGSDGADPGAGV